MTVRSTALALAGAGVLASVLTPVTSAQADNWRYVNVYRALGACQSAGRGLVARHQVREYRCENDYDKAGVPVLDLYTR